MRIKEYVNAYVEKHVKELWPSKTTSFSYTDDSSHLRDWNRYIQITSNFVDMTIHYEYTCNYMFLHIEEPDSYEKTDINRQFNYRKIVDYLKHETATNPLLKWEKWQNRYDRSCRYNLQIDDLDHLGEAIDAMIRIFDPIISNCLESFKTPNPIAPYTECWNYPDLPLNENEDVSLFKLNILQLFDINITIPTYQRIYCWGDSQVLNFLDNLSSIPKNQEYHLGSIILHKHDNDYEIIDGQQRLVTLTLLLRALGFSGHMPLLKHKFDSNQAQENVANTKYLIERFRDRNCSENSELLSIIINNIVFSVLVINSNNLDLAYTFFSNQNSKGVRLSDYDILKAHHLRFVLFEEQAEHLAKRWNFLSQDMESSDETYLEYSLGIHLYRLRSWMRRHSSNPTEDRYIRDEYVAAKTMEGIPPFGETFDFYEKIIGGSHFFAYCDKFVYCYKEFINTQQVKLLRANLVEGSHRKYESVIETLLFGYFLKFGKLYLSEALFCVSNIIATIRYERSHARETTINDYACDSEVILMIDQASSPSFFLAEALDFDVISGADIEGDGVQKRFYWGLQRIFTEILSYSFGSNCDAILTDKHIIQLIIKEYE